MESQKAPISASTMGFLIEAGPHVDEVGIMSLFDIESQQLPPREVAMDSIDGTSIRVVYTQ